MRSDGGVHDKSTDKSADKSVMSTDEERWRAHVAKQNADYEHYSRNCDNNTLGTEEVMARKQKRAEYSDRILNAPVQHGVVDDQIRKEREDLVRKKERHERKEKKKQKKLEKEKATSEASTPNFPTPREEDANGVSQKDVAEFNDEIEWREFLLQVRDMIQASDRIEQQPASYHFISHRTHTSSSCSLHNAFFISILPIF